MPYSKFPLGLPDPRYHPDDDGGARRRRTEPRARAIGKTLKLFDEPDIPAEDGIR